MSFLPRIRSFWSLRWSCWWTTNMFCSSFRSIALRSCALQAWTQYIVLIEKSKILALIVYLGLGRWPFDFMTFKTNFKLHAKLLLHEQYIIVFIIITFDDDWKFLHDLMYQYFLYKYGLHLLLVVKTLILSEYHKLNFTHQTLIYICRP